MLTNYKGPANHRDVFQHLVGEEIVASFQRPGNDGVQTYLVMKSGPALVINDPIKSY